MGLIKNIALAILALSLVVFCALFGSLPRLRKTPVGFVNRLIWIKVPSLLLSIDNLATGGRLTWFLKRTGHYLMHENHPLVLIFYLTILLGAELTFLPPAWPRLLTHHQLLTILLVLIPYVLTYLTVRSTSSVITAFSHAEHMRQYPYDRILFYPGQTCRTCLRLKPARSKHCAICNVCIAKHDHHCIWIMNCLGRGNYGLFLGMLASLGTLLSYGTYLAYILLDALLQARLAPAPNIVASESTTSWGQGKSFGQRFDLWAWAFTEDIRVGCVGLLAAFTAPLAWGLLSYHVYLIWAGMTTSESFKWDEWKEDVADGYVVKTSLPRVISHDDAQGNSGTTTPASTEASAATHTTPKFGQDHNTARAMQEAKDKDKDDIEPYVSWPGFCRERYASMANRLSRENEPSARLDDGNNHSNQWRRVRGLSEVTNIYDLGFWDNLVDAIRLS